MSYKRVMGVIFVLWCGLTLSYGGTSKENSTEFSSRSKKIFRLTKGNYPSLYAANEIIVKLKEPVSNKLKQTISPGNGNDNLSVSISLANLRAKHRVKNFKKLFPQFEGKTNNINKKFSQRQKRISAYSSNPKALDKIYKLEVEPAPGQSIEDIVQAYNQDSNIEYAELNYIVSINLIPNDTLFFLQWPLNNIGQMYPESGSYNHPPGTTDVDIDAPEAWDVTTGLTEVVIAVVDSGVYYNHRDLQNKKWINQAELNGLGGVDDDNNGFVDDKYGYDFLNNDGDPFDDNGHGTHCAGIIAADVNNNFDIAGVCWKGRIMALKFIDQYGYGTTGDAAEAIYYAVENGADVISNSWGGQDYSQVLQDAINYAHSKAVIFTAAAGNANSNTPFYPAACDNVISVAATNSKDQKAPFSSYGDWVDIAAPGVDILSLRAQQKYIGVAYNGYTSVASGTSMACPFVAGTCASLISANPTLTVDEIYNMLIQSGDPIANGICWSNKRINLFNLLSLAKPSKGRLSLDKNVYSCSDVIKIRLGDYDLAGAGTQPVSLTTISGDSETVILNEDVNNPGVFTASIPAEAGDAVTEDGRVQISMFGIIYAAYEDIDDGSGNPAIIRVTASTDCITPSISDINLQKIGAGGVIIQVLTNEKTTANIRYGTNCGTLSNTADNDANFTQNHTIRIKGLESSTDYYFAVDLNDIAGNHIYDVNSGSCYHFTTLPMTERFVPGDFNTIQEAIDSLWDGDIVTVLDGTYTSQGNTDLDFRGNAVMLRSQNGPANCIINCAGSASHPHRAFNFNSQENCNTVVFGFTIENGYAVYEGGAIKCFDSSPTIENCIFLNNSAGDYGSAISNNNHSSGVIRNCIFRQNRIRGYSWVEYGGGTVSNILRSDSIFEGCLFVANSSQTDSGAMYNLESSPLLVNCSFFGNTAYYLGGALLNQAGDIVMINCLFSGNLSENQCGGAICNMGINAELINCTIANNSATCASGGIANTEDCSTTLSNCILWANSVEQTMDMNSQVSGGLLQINYSCIQGLTTEWNHNGNLDSNPLFLDADGPDGIIGTEDDRLSLRINSPCIDAGNNSLVPQSVITDLIGQPRFADQEDIPDTGFGTPPIVDMGAIEGPRQCFLLDSSVVSVPEGTSSSFTIKLAVKPKTDVEVSVVFESGDTDITIESGTPVVFSPSDYNQPKTVFFTAAPDADYLNGRAVFRIEAVGVDSVKVNAIEEDSTIPPAVLFVDVNAAGANDGADWTNAFHDLQDALEIASRPSHSVREIQVAQGIYKPDVNGGNRQSAFKLINGVTLYGGFPSGGASFEQRNPKLYKTILSGDINGDDVPDFTNMNDNRDNVIITEGLDSTAAIDGFTITGGRASGMYNNSSSPTLNNCTFYLNSSLFGGGMLNFQNSNPIIINCIFKNNYADYGAGVCNYSQSSPTIINCIFSLNYAAFGAGLENEESSPIITDCRFIDNLSDNRGGGVYNYGDNNSIFTRCIFAGNSSSLGGAIGNDSNSANTILTNCTFYNNYSYDKCGGMYNTNAAAPIITNCIFWENSDTNGTEMSSQIFGGNPVINYSCVMGSEGILAGTGNIDADPLFSPNNDFHLKSEAGRWSNATLSWVTDSQTSPCIDAGDPNMSFGNELWPHGRRINMGAFGGTAQASMSLSNAGNIADLNNDGIVNITDFGIFANLWMQAETLSEGDLNRNRKIDMADLQILISQWLWEE